MSSLVASGTLHASNTIALFSLGPGAYQVGVVCSSSFCLPEPAKFPFYVPLASPDSLRQAAGSALASATPVHVLRPSVTVRHLQAHGQDGAQQSGASQLAKLLMQGLLVVILLGAQGVSLACSRA